MPEMFPGSRKKDGFVIPVPVAARAGIGSVEVRGAAHKILQINPAAFYVVIPNTVPDAPHWEVFVHNGILRVRPPRPQQGGSTYYNIASEGANVGVQASVMYGPVTYGDGVTSRSPRPTVGLVLPRKMPVSSQQ